MILNSPATYSCDIINCQFIFIGHQAMSIPVTRAPVQRLFSSGSLKMRPHGARTGVDLLSALTLLKSKVSYGLLKHI